VANLNSRDAQQSAQPSGVLDDEPMPDVWWGEDGIDALIWADPRPYDGRPSETNIDAPAVLLAGDPQ
jgi:hypothetical protein